MSSIDELFAVISPEAPKEAKIEHVAKLRQIAFEYNDILTCIQDDMQRFIFRFMGHSLMCSPLMGANHTVPSFFENCRLFG